MDSVTSNKILKQAISQQAELHEDTQGLSQKLLCYNIRLLTYELQLMCFCRKNSKQKKTVELNACDSSDDEDSDGDESIGNMEFPEYVS